MKKARECNTLMECYLGSIYWQKKVMRKPKSKQWEKRFNSYIYRYHDHIIISPKSHQLRVINRIPKTKAEEKVKKLFYGMGYLFSE